MTKKDYEKIAAAVKLATEVSMADASKSTEYTDGMRRMRSEIVSRLCDTMRAENPRFDEQRFRNACLAA